MPGTSSRTYGQPASRGDRDEITDALRDGELAARAVAATVTGASAPASAMRWYAELRDDFAVPMYDATKRLASFDLDLEEILTVLREMGDESEREARFLPSLDDWDGIEGFAPPAVAVPG